MKAAQCIKHTLIGCKRIKCNGAGIMRSRDLFDKRRIQIFDYRTGDFMRYEGDKRDIEKPEKQAEQEKENILQTKLF